MPFEMSQEAPFRLPAEPAAVGILCYPGVAIEQIAAPYFRLAGLAGPDGSPACAIALVGPSRGPVRAAGNRTLSPDHALGAGLPEFDLLVAPCGFVASVAFEGRGGTATLLEAILAARQVLLTAALAAHARRAQMLLRAASTMPSGAFWEATRPACEPGATRLIADGRLTWAIGPDAAAAGIDHVVSELAPTPIA